MAPPTSVHARALSGDMTPAERSLYLEAFPTRRPYSGGIVEWNGTVTCWWQVVGYALAFLAAFVVIVALLAVAP